MKIRLLRPAFQDLLDARAFYDRQSAGLGDSFFDSLFAEIDSLSLKAGVHSRHFGFFRLLAQRFPYAIYYKKAAGEVLIFRILDCRRDPKQTRKDLKESG